MKNIKIELLQQKQGTFDCGPVCVQMVLNYFKIKRDFEVLKKDLTFYQNGTSAYDNGSLLIAAGLKVTAITAQPYLFSLDTIASIDTRDKLLTIVEEAEIKMKRFSIPLKTLEKFLKDGGNFKIEIPSLKHIKDAIDKDSLVIALLCGTALGKNEGGFHFVVVSGYDKDRVFINNPGINTKKQAWFPVENFLYAVHTSTMFDIDNGTFLVISK